MSNEAGDGNPSPYKHPSLIHVTRDEEGILIISPPAGVSTLAPFPAFLLPHLPLSQHSWLTGLGREFQYRHERCIAALLIINVQKRFWATPLIPSQTCGHDGSAWTLDFGDQTLLPRHRIGGSFQVRIVRGMIDASDTVPPFDGIHIVQTFSDAESMAYCFLRVDGETTVVHPENAMRDDWADALAEAAPRMTFD